MAMVKKLKYFFALIALCSVFSAFSPLMRVGANRVKTIVIDAGHGGKDPGCSGAVHNEKEVALAVALRLGKLIEENFKDVKVIYTRTTDVFVELEDRAQIANKAKADLFISIHCNAAGKAVMIKDPKTGKKRVKTYKNKKGKIVVVEKPNPLPFGTETYVMGLKNEEGKMKVATRENSAIFYEEDYEKKYGGFDPESEESYIIMSNYTSAYVIQSASLAMKIQEEYTNKAGRIDKGVHRQSIWVLWRTSMPSILTELGYLTNPLEETFLSSEKGQDYLAKALFRGLRRYKDEIEGKKKDYDDEFENQEALENENIKAGNILGQKKPEEDEEEIKQPLPEKKELVEAMVQSVPDVKKEPDTRPVPDSLPPAERELKDSVITDVPAKEDSVILSAREIAQKFKQEQQERAETRNNPKQEPDKAVAEPVKNAGPPKNKDTSQTILFKVQFASSDQPLNLEEDKYKEIVDGSYYKLKAIYKYTSGNFSLLKEAVRHQNLLREKGFKDCFVIAFRNGERIDIKLAIAQAGQ